MHDREEHGRGTTQSGEASREPRFGDSPKPHGDTLPGRGGAVGAPGGAEAARETAGELEGDLEGDPTHDAAGRPADDA